MNNNTADTKPSTQTKRTKGKKAPTGPGRPKGSPNRDYVDVVVIPPKCPSCHTAIDVKRGKRYREVQYAQIHADGTKTNRVRWYRTACACGQAISYRRYEFEEENNNPGGNI